MSTLNTEVYRELTTLNNIGVTVSSAALKKAKTEDLSEYNNMSISEIADLLTELY